MASKTVSEFAQELKVAAKTLLAQLRAAGVNKASETDELSETDKARLLDSLRVERTQSAQRKITVTRKEQSVVKQQDGSGRSRAIPVEVRRKRVFVKNPPGARRRGRPCRSRGRSGSPRRRGTGRCRSPSPCGG